MTQVLFLDVAPDPVSTGIGFAGLILIGIVVLLFAGAALTGLVFLVRRLTQTAGSGTRVVVGDACLNLDSLVSRSNRVTSPAISPTAQPENSPNQP
jgi:hypothetical protein